MTPRKIQIKLNLNSKYNNQTEPIFIGQGDVGVVIETQLYAGNNLLDLTDYAVTFFMRRPAGVYIMNMPCTITDAKRGIVMYTLTAKDSQYSGSLSAYFLIQNQAQTSLESTPEFKIMIY